MNRPILCHEPMHYPRGRRIYSETDADDYDVISDDVMTRKRSPHDWPFCEGNPSVIGGFLSQWVSAEL